MPSVTFCGLRLTDSKTLAKGVSTAKSLKNGEYIVTGFSKAAGEGGGTFFLRTDPLGNLLVYQTYRFFNGGHSMLETPTGDVIIAGNALDFATFEDASLLHVDGFGNLNWCMAYGDGGTGQEFGEAVALMPGGGFQLAAWTNVFGSGNFDIYTVRTDVAGISTCNERPHQPVVISEKPARNRCGN